MPKIEENLRQPFEEHELPGLMKQLNVDNQRDLEIEVARLVHAGHHDDRRQPDIAFSFPEAVPAAAKGIRQEPLGSRHQFGGRPPRL